MNHIDTDNTVVLTEPQSSDIPNNSSNSRDVNEYICFNIRKASRAITLVCDESIRRANLRSTQFTILLALSQKGSITIGKLAEELWIDPTALSRNLQPLEKSGYIELQPGADRRTRFISLTEKGTAKTAEALKHWDDTHEQLQYHLKEQNLSQLHDSLNLFLEAVKKVR